MAGPVGEGLWLPHEYAEQQGIQVGDELVVTQRKGTSGVWPGPESAAAAVTLPVAAIYQDLRTAPLTDYWCGVESVYAGTSFEQADPDAVILPTALLDEDTLLTVGATTRSVLHQVINLPVTDPELTAPEAARLAADIQALQRTLAAQPDAFPNNWYGTASSSRTWTPPTAGCARPHRFCHRCCRSPRPVPDPGRGGGGGGLRTNGVDRS